jgi:hypothetical protein
MNPKQPVIAVIQEGDRPEKINLGGRVSRWIRNPSVQFFASLILAPVFAIAGEAFGGHLSAPGLAGMFLTFSVVTLAALRSYRRERALLPPANIFSQITGRNSLLVRYLFGVATLSIILGAAAIATAVALAVDLLL